MRKIYLCPYSDGFNGGVKGCYADKKCPLYDERKCIDMALVKVSTIANFMRDLIKYFEGERR